MSVNLDNGDVIQVRLRFGLSDEGSRLFNILYYQVSNLHVVSSGLPPAIAVPFALMGPSIANEVANKFKAEWADAASEEMFFEEVTVQDIYPGDRSRSFHTPAGTIAVGLVDSEALPAQDAPTILKKSDYGERWGLGRMFFIGTPESGQKNGQLTEGQATLINLFALLMNDNLGPSNTTYACTLKPVLFAKLPAGDYRITPVTEAELSDVVIKTQRRRRPGKGE